MSHAWHRGVMSHTWNIHVTYTMMSLVMPVYVEESCPSHTHGNVMSHMVYGGVMSHVGHVYGGAWSCHLLYMGGVTDMSKIWSSHFTCCIWTWRSCVTLRTLNESCHVCHVYAGPGVTVNTMTTNTSTAALLLCAASRIWVRHRLVVIVPSPPEARGGFKLEFRWKSEMCLWFILWHVTVKLVSGTTQRSVIDSRIAHVSYHTVTYDCVLSHIEESCHVWMSNVSRQRSVIESQITHASSCPPQTVRRENCLQVGSRL